MYYFGASTAYSIVDCLFVRLSFHITLLRISVSYRFEVVIGYRVRGYDFDRRLELRVRFGS